MSVVATAVAVMSLSAASPAQIAVGISVRIGPPALPVYAQPIAPGPGYLWTPGYWGWNDDGGYYWVPGTWVVAPVGMLWTPGYWGFAGGFYGWHGGYWGPHIGFYGGINYGFGYGGVGFAGGEWRGGAFYYNRAVTNVSVTNVTNVYNKTVVVNNTTTTSFNGEGGVKAEPTAEERTAMNEPHTAPLAAQTQQEHLASQNKQNFASVNGGKPAIAATSKAGDFSAKSAVPARSSGGEYHAPAMSPKEARAGAPAGNNNAGNKPSTPATQADRPANTANQSHPAATQNESKPSTPSKPAPQSKPAPKSKPAPAAKHSSPPKNEKKGR
jgi:WXXGXW repeat (2 copies)